MAIDLLLGLLLINVMSTTVPPEKLPRLRKARILILILFGISLAVLCIQLVYTQEWI